MPGAFDTRRAREWDGRSLFLNAHIAQFVGVVLGLEQIGRTTEDEHSETDQDSYDQHGDLLS
jgi:hypothetical protein